MKKIFVNYPAEIPDKFTGIVCFKSAKKEAVSVGEMWYKNGLCHRLDGPASIWEFTFTKNKKSKAYLIENISYSKEEFYIKTSLVQQQLPKRHADYKYLTDEQWNEYLEILVTK